MTNAVAATLVFFPFYLLLRKPYQKLPLHIDTGFYVSNHTIARKHFDFSKGWNAHYAGCSKILPELFYSLIYLFHGCEGYARWSRFYASLFNYVTAIAVGLLTCAVFAFDEKHYLAGLAAYALLSSEPHWGGYFECGELFHVLTDSASVLMLMHGLSHADSLWVGAAAFTFSSGACFIKLSAGIAFAAVFAGTALWHPIYALPMAGGAVVALVVFAAWVRLNGQSVFRLLGPLHGHERAFSKGTGWAGIAHRLREKDQAFYRVVKQQPWLMMLALIGVIFAAPGSPIFWFYAIGCLAAYVAQAADCRYYLIPMWPVLTVLAGSGALAILDLGTVGVAIVCGAIGAWFFWNPVRAFRLSDRELNLWSWTGGIRTEESDRNFVLHQACEKLREGPVAGSMLVYGPRNQAYAMLGASYETPMVAPEIYLDEMVPGWQQRINRQLRTDPPDWIFDTGRCFNARQACTRLGLDYRMSHFAAESLQVYRRIEILEVGDLEVKTFASLSLEDLEAEKKLAGDQLVFMQNHEGRPAARIHDSAGMESDAVGRALADLLGQLRRAGHSRLAIYGAGRFTLRHAEVYRRSGIPIAMVLDDAAGPDARCGEWSVYSPDEVDPSEFDAVVVSSDRFAGRMIARLRNRWGDRVAGFVIPGCR
jgi:hypothetical protein